MLDLSNYLRRYTDAVESEVLTKIDFSDKVGGISHGELAKALGMDRKTLRRYTKNLIQQHMIRRADGKQGKYFLCYTKR